LQERFDAAPVQLRCLPVHDCPAACVLHDVSPIHDGLGDAALVTNTDIGERGIDLIGRFRLSAVPWL
jgi:hypothetical protein